MAVRVVRLGGPVVRTLVGLLAAVGTAASALVGLIHGSLIVFALCIAAVAAGLASFAGAASKKTVPKTDISAFILFHFSLKND
jgi:Na+-transporting NADH:ubiquinone oxidoreductase subunit NqrB